MERGPTTQADSPEPCDICSAISFVKIDVYLYT
jgi:hypothetical protein